MEPVFEFCNKIGIYKVLLWSRGSSVEKKCLNCGLERQMNERWYNLRQNQDTFLISKLSRPAQVSTIRLFNTYR